MKVDTDREKGLLHFEGQPEIGLRLTELQTPDSAGCAWKRLRGLGVDDVAIKELFIQAKYVERTLSNSARYKVESVATEQMKHLGADTAWAVIDLVASKARSPSAAASQIIGQMENDGLSAKEIGNQFEAWSRA